MYLEFLSCYLFILFVIFVLCKYSPYKYITLYVVFPSKGKGGPYSLSKYIHAAINKWNKHKILSKIALLIYKESLELELLKNIFKNKNTYVWFERANFISLTKNSSYNGLFKNIIYGPIVTPLNWFNMPRNNTYEKYWCLIMKKIKAFVTHSNRVKFHIIKSNKCYLYTHKYIILKPCIETDFIKLYTNKYSERYIDFLVYIKYADISRKKDERILINYLSKIYKIVIVKYGNHTKQSLLYLANNSKFVIYYSFYDTGALSLVEMKLMGIWPISHQEEFIEQGYGSFIKELDTNINDSLSKLNDIYNIKYNPQILSQNVVDNLNCVNSLYNVINSFIYKI